MPASPPVWFLADDLMQAHDPGPSHPESPARLATVLERLHRRSWPNVHWQKPTPAAREHLKNVHTQEYIERVDRARGLTGELDPDVPISADSVDVAYLAAGAGVNAIDALLTGQASRAFVLARPPGHHAEQTFGMGFCIYNNVAVAAAYTRTLPGVERVLIVDWDVHHGNGTEHLFAARDDILVVNIHQAPHYPGSGRLADAGRARGLGYTVNVPLPVGMGDGDYASIFETIVAPIAHSYRPDLVLVSAGFDPHVDDPLGDMAVTAGGFANICAQVQALADHHANGRLCLFLEGGYNLEGLAQGVTACAEVLCGAEPSAVTPASATGRRVVELAREAHVHRWPVLAPTTS